MEGYTISHGEMNIIGKPDVIEQINFHLFKRIEFHGWVGSFAGVSQTVAIFKIKWKYFCESNFDIDRPL